MYSQNPTQKRRNVTFAAEYGKRVRCLTEVVLLPLIKGLNRVNFCPMCRFISTTLIKYHRNYESWPYWLVILPGSRNPACQALSLRVKWPDI